MGAISILFYILKFSSRIIYVIMLKSESININDNIVSCFLGMHSVKSMIKICITFFHSKDHTISSFNDIFKTSEEKI